MERESDPLQPLCRSGCGFFGNPATEGLCSLCYKNALKKKQSLGLNPIQTCPIAKPKHVSPRVDVLPKIAMDKKSEKELEKKKEPEQPGANAISLVDEEVAGTSAAVVEEKTGTDQKPKNRCAVCRKKLGLTAFPCRCGGLYCPVHRYSDRHDCSYDYRAVGAEEIAKNNPVVNGDKIKKI